MLNDIMNIGQKYKQMLMDQESTEERLVFDEARFNQERERMHRNMLSSVSHDLKTPLSSVIGSLQIHQRLANVLSPEKKTILIETALVEAQRLDNFITNLLDMTKLEGGMVRTCIEEFDLKRVVDEAIMCLPRMSATSAIKVRAAREEVACTSDPMLLGRAIFLVLDNAVKYGRNVEGISVIYGKRGNQVYIKISDSGPGIAPEKHDEIFNKYTRLERQDHQIAGTGLGLSICRELMKLLGGSVQLESEVGKGSTFTLTLPFAAE